MQEAKWHRVVFFDRLAEITGEYLKKRNSVYIKGAAKPASGPKDGVEKYTTEIMDGDVQLLDAPRFSTEGAI